MPSLTDAAYSKGSFGVCDRTTLETGTSVNSSQVMNDGGLCDRTTRKYDPSMKGMPSI